MQHEPIDPGFDGNGGLDPDGWVWVRGVDYLAGWRSANDAASELTAAMTGAGIDTSEMTATADTAPDGSGVLRLSLSAGTAFELAQVVRDGVAGLGKTG
ncbi:hypothetical protein [Streptomyces sp. NBC_00690]|uniref:hypothetical protein n=1 Tax=Streptomyces sp. NBC_00690 TaxID=2975808 RepID=UPI002E2CE75F|nr:hypothetical protein [Streptomyces sp. NBC_00690]